MFDRLRHCPHWLLVRQEDPHDRGHTALACLRDCHNAARLRLALWWGGVRGNHGHSGGVRGRPWSFWGAYDVGTSRALPAVPQILFRIGLFKEMLSAFSLVFGIDPSFMGHPE